MAYNKSKFVEAAQKLLNQGKVAQAIAEYQNILKYEPRDQVTLMTIGELYIRQGETFQAIDYFERLAQIFVGDGFLTKAIAVYKRIAKLAPEEIRPLEKLADLYVQQGVMSEARPLFLQLAEIHLKNNRHADAVSLLKKLLQAEPDNIRIQIRLADLYQVMGQAKEAIEAYVSAAQRALARGDHAECEKLADKALKLEPQNLPAITVRARSYSAQGNFAKAEQLLSGLPELEKGGEQTELLQDLLLKSSNWEKAISLATRVFEADEKNFGPMQKIVEALIQAGHCDKAMEVLQRSRIPMIDAGEHEVVMKMLNDLAAKMPGQLQPLEWLVELYGRTSDSFRLPDALANLGDALVLAKDDERAKQIYEQLVDKAPESESARRKLNGVLHRMGLLDENEAPQAFEQLLQAEIAQPPAPRIYEQPMAAEVPALPTPAVVQVESQLDEETQKFINQSLTDVDLFASYGLTQKAIGLLEAILRRAPRHTPTLEKLLDFVLGAGDDRRTAELAAQLEQIHLEYGDSRSAERFGELRRRFQRAAGLSDSELAMAVPETAIPEAQTEAVEETVAELEISAVAVEPVEEMQVPVELQAQLPIEAETAPDVEELQEVDLSDEWSSLLDASQTQEQPVPVQTGAAGLPAPATDISSVEEFAIGAEPSMIPPVDTPAIAAFDLRGANQETLSPLVPPSAASPAPPLIPTLSEPEESEFELEQEYELVLEPEALVPAHEQKPPEKPLVPGKGDEIPAETAAESFAGDQFLSDLSKEIDQLGSGPAAVASASNSSNGQRPIQPPTDEASPLQEIFEEFRAELGETGVEDEDLETHYNLGIAFREMGLLEEAISEFQKVAKANGNGRPFRYAMQCCTLLGLSFMEKGQPSISAIWYERALQTPGNDAETVLALRYDLGVAQEAAGELDSALKSFSQVYAVNIDYRDVAERIHSLQKPAR
jgi:tetratricopeptide (TPR) repeat protein